MHRACHRINLLQLVNAIMETKICWADLQSNLKNYLLAPKFRTRSQENASDIPVNDNTRAKRYAPGLSCNMKFDNPDSEG